MLQLRAQPGPAPHILCFGEHKTSSGQNPRSQIGADDLSPGHCCDREGEKGDGKGLADAAWQGNEIVISAGFTWLLPDLLGSLSASDER